MAIFKFTYIFEQLDQGWSESYYAQKTGNDPSAQVASAIAVGNRRIALSGLNTMLTYVRIANIEVPRTVFLYHVTPTAFGIPTQESEDANTTLPLKFMDATRAKFKTSFIRGIWDSVVDRGGAFSPTPGYTTNLNNFLNEIRNQGFGWLGISINQSQNITALVQNANGTVTGTLAADLFPPQALGKRAVVRFAGLTQPGNLNGANPVLVEDARIFTTLKRIAILPWTGGGKLTLAGKQVYPIVTMIPGQIGERKAGRIFASARGRAPARKRA